MGVVSGRITLSNGVGGLSISEYNKWSTWYDRGDKPLKLKRNTTIRAR